MAATTTQYEVGTVVTARPWKQGVEQDPRSGIVIGDPLGNGEYTAVWFHTLGELDREDEGHAVQFILTSKVTVNGSLADWKPETLKRLAKRVRAHNHSRDVYVLNALGFAYRDATQRVAA